MFICHYEIKQVGKQNKHGLRVVIVWFWYLKANARRVRYKLVLICYIIKRWEVSRNKPLLKRWKVTILLLVILAQIKGSKTQYFPGSVLENLFLITLLEISCCEARYSWIEQVYLWKRAFEKFEVIWST